MAEGFKVRLVLCPKCKNVLPERPDYSVYQCGGCGTVLRAKKKVNVGDGLVEKPGKGKDGEGFEMAGILSEIEGGSVGNASETEREGDGVNPARRKDRVFRERTENFASNSLLRTERKEGVSIDNGKRNLKELNMGYQSGPEKGIGFADKYRQRLKERVAGLVRPEVGDLNMNRSQSVNSSRLKAIGEISAQFENPAGSLRSRVTMDPGGLNGYGLRGSYVKSRMAVDHRKCPTFAYPDEGPSNYHLASSSSSSYGYRKGVNNYSNLNATNAQADPIKMLDDLREQLSRFHVAGDEDQRERSRVPVQALAPGHAPNEFPAYEDPFQFQNTRVHSHQVHHQYWHQPPGDYFPRNYMDPNLEREASTSYPHLTLYNQPSSSCSCCYNRNLHAHPQATPPLVGGRKFPKDSGSSNFKGSADPLIFGPKNYNSKLKSPIFLQAPQSAGRWPADIESDIDGFHSRPRRVVVARGNRRLCHPLAGGAPFATCYNCFELLKLPSKLKARKKTQWKLKCASCSVVLLLETENKRLIISAPAENKKRSVEADDSPCNVSKEVLVRTDGCQNSGGTNFSDDFDNPGYGFDSADFEDNMPSKDQRINLRKPEEGHGLTSSSVLSAEGERLDAIVVQRDDSYSVELPAKDGGSPRVEDSPLAEDEVDACSHNDLSRYGEGNKSKRADEEKFFGKSASRHNPLKDVSVATEVEVSFNDYLNNSLSQDSLEVSKEEDKSRINKGSESFFVGLIKKSYRDISRLDQQKGEKRSSVFVNGNRIPEGMVKKAEKQAGPILPGNYWYDFRAGFWGVMGHPCLGIIPPFIEEFKHPMPRNCAAGDTGVFVNGRELHQNDLDLLSNRGLPKTREKFYTLEISGIVLDADTGEELHNLGNLAPTVEKMKHGFGMGVPRRLLS